jgi:hypothetical protein
MEQSSENENKCDVFMIEIRIKDEILVEPKEMVNL